MTKLNATFPAGPAIPTATLLPADRRIVSRGGASASIEERDGEERIAVRDASARLVFELDPETGRCVVASAGDLSISAGGDVEIVAGGSIRCRSEKQIALEAGSDGSSSRFVLGKALAELTSRALRLAFTEASVSGERFAAKVGEAKLALTRLETVTERLFERAHSVFRTVEDLHQLRARRTRTLVKDGYYVKGGHATLEAEAEMKIDGKTIHLG